MLGKAACQTPGAGHSSSVWTTLHPAGADLAAPRGRMLSNWQPARNEGPFIAKKARSVDGHSRTESSCVTLIAKYRRTREPIAAERDDSLRQPDGYCSCGRI